MLQPENQSKKYEQLFAEIDSGHLKIPAFQRDFVWTTAQTAGLIDSIIKGFPIGTFILWRTHEEMRSIRLIGSVPPRKGRADEPAVYVLDGQQRITSLYAVRKGSRVAKDGQIIDYKDISINLTCDPMSDEQIVLAEAPEGVPCISVHKLLNGTLAELARKYGPYLDEIDLYRRRLTGYDFPVILLPYYPIDIACDIFTRINTGGTRLSLFEIMVARSFDQGRNFDLAREYERLIDSDGASRDLDDAGYETLPEQTALQCVAAALVRQVGARDILKLDKAQFIDTWPEAKSGIFSAVDFLRGHVQIPVSLLMPYYALIVPLSYFFVRNGYRPPTARQAKLLTQYFWWVSLSGWFSQNGNSRIAQDLDRMDDILAERVPSYDGHDIHISLEDLRSRWFSTSDAYCKAIICLYASFQPRSFASNGLVNIDNSWLKVASSKNYHHFFPKAYLTKAGFSVEEANSILNITLVDDYLNKTKIGSKSPSTYMAEFRKGNRDLETTMRTHLVDDLAAYGVWSNDYRAFIEMRGNRVIQELKKRLEPELD